VSGFILVVTFVVAQSHIIFTDNGPRELGAFTEKGVAYTIRMPTDEVRVFSCVVASLADAKRVAIKEPPPDSGLFSRGWEHGPAVVIELATGKVIRLTIKPKMVKRTREVEEQDGYVAVEEKP
jgi:hypothetical protein